MNLETTEVTEATEVNADENLDKKATKLKFAKAQWQESEWRLNFLRTQAGKPIEPPTDQALIDWYLNPKTQ